MGLDQNFFSRSGVEVDQKGNLLDREGEEIHYWRKHNRLQGWFEREYRNQGGEGEFNTAEVNVTEDVLNRLEKDIKDSALPETRGFFFGSDSYQRYDSENDLEAIKKAREELARGRQVYYWSWW
jgi:hypothetical protein